MRSKITQSTGELRAAAFMRQRISIVIQRGNSFSVLGTHYSETFDVNVNVTDTILLLLLQISRSNRSPRAQ